MNRLLPFAALVLTLAVPTAAQTGELGAVTNSPPPEGLSEGEGAGYPKGSYHELDTLPDWGGIWFSRERPSDGMPSLPKLKGEFQKQREAFRKAVIENDGVVPRSRSNCMPSGMPGFMRTWQYPFEFLFNPGRVTIHQELWMQTRTIWTDGRDHPDPNDLDPTYMGHSIGHWEGDTLVVDTVGMQPSTGIPGGGVEHSDQFRVVERIYLDPENPDQLLNDTVLYDPEALEEPFAYRIRYGRDRNGSLMEFVCAENNRNPIDENGNTLFE